MFSLYIANTLALFFLMMYMLIYVLLAFNIYVSFNFIFFFLSRLIQLICLVFCPHLLTECPEEPIELKIQTMCRYGTNTNLGKCMKI